MGGIPILLIAGSHGRSAVGRMILGSVSHKVLHEAHCSVRISKQIERKDNADLRILLAVDGSECAEQMVKAVAGRHWSEKTEIRLIAVDDPVFSTGSRLRYLELSAGSTRRQRKIARMEKKCNRKTRRHFKVRRTRRFT